RIYTYGLARPSLSSRPRRACSPGGGRRRASHNPLFSTREGIMELPLGELLVTMSHITKDQLAEALDLQKEQGGKLGHILISMGVISEEEILRALSVKLAIPL